MIIRKKPLRPKVRSPRATHQSMVIGQWKFAENEQGDLTLTSTVSGQTVVLIRSVV